MVEISSGNADQDYAFDGNRFMRYFSEGVESDEMVWHRDENDREVEVIKGHGWQFQYDNEMPKPIKEGDVLLIKAMEFHRLIKGKTELILRITES